MHVVYHGHKKASRRIPWLAMLLSLVGG